MPLLRCSPAFSLLTAYHTSTALSAASLCEQFFCRCHRGLGRNCFCSDQQCRQRGQTGRSFCRRRPNEKLPKGCGAARELRLWLVVASRAKKKLAGTPAWLSNSERSLQLRARAIKSRMAGKKRAEAWPTKPDRSERRSLSSCEPKLYIATVST